MKHTALVLGGGGAKGSYQMGVWRAVREAGLSFDMIIGTSIGAINGALMVQDDYERASEIWESIEYQNILPQERENDIKTINNALGLIRFAINDALPKGSVDCAGLEALIKKYVDEDKIRASKTDYGLVTVEVSSLRPLELTKSIIPKGKLASYIMASSACFPVFSPYEIDGAYYLDGGYYDNVPVNFAISRGAKDIIAVDLDGIGLLHEPLRGETARVRRVHSRWDLGAVFDFDRSLFKRNQILGYHDTMKALEMLEGFAYTFNKGECLKNAKALTTGQQEFLDIIFELSTKPISRAKSLIDRKDEAMKLLRQSEVCENALLVLCHVAEAAGALFALPCEPLYDFKEFNENLLQLYLRQNAEDEVLSGTAAAVSQHLAKRGDYEEIAELVKTISSLKKGEPSRRICALAVRLLQMKDGAQRYREALANITPREYAAAAYICLLLKNQAEAV